MSDAESAVGSIAPSGLVVAGVGFVLTRGTVVTGAESSAAQFLFAGLVPLVLGLSLSAFGVVLTVGSFSRSYVRRVAGWSLAGTATMVVFLLLGAAGQSPDGVFMRLLSELGSDQRISSVLLGGALGGTVTGVYSARSARQRDRLRYRTERVRVLNRLLRDRVLNAVNVIQGQLDLFETAGDASPGQRSVEMLSDRTRAIETVVDDVSYLVTGDTDDSVTVRLRGVTGPLATAVERARARYPVEDLTDDDYAVWAGADLEQSLYLVISAAANATGSPGSVTVDASGGRRDRVDISVRATPTDHGVVDPADDPEAGTKLELAELIIDRYGGTVATGTETIDGTAYSTVSVSLPRASSQSLEAHSGSGEPRSVVSGRYGVPISRLLSVIVAALIAGIAMGGTMTAISGIVPTIGALYGFTDPVVGWVTHLFHSVVFGIIYAGLLVVVPERYADRFAVWLGLALAWSLLLWAGAAGLVMPVWLRAVGIPAALPQLTATSFVGHAVWGVTLATTYRLLVNLVMGVAADRRGLTSR